MAKKKPPRKSPRTGSGRRDKRSSGKASPVKQGKPRKQAATNARGNKGPGARKDTQGRKPPPLGALGQALESQASINAYCPYCGVETDDQGRCVNIGPPRCSHYGHVVTGG